MADEVNYLVFDILGDLCFGKNFNMKEPESDLKHVPELMATYLQILQPVRNLKCLSGAHIVDADQRQTKLA